MMSPGDLKQLFDIDGKFPEKPLAALEGNEIQEWRCHVSYWGDERGREVNTYIKAMGKVAFSRSR